MLFNTLLLLLLGVIVFFHYVQGAFSSFISAVVATIAASVAIGYHENVIVSLLGGKATDMSIAMTIVGLFAITYLVLRYVLDRSIPGNVRLPVTADRIAAGCFGLIAGVFAVGTLAVAAQTLPTGTYTIDFARYSTSGTRGVAFNLGTGSFGMDDIELRGELESPVASEETRSNLWFPVDQFTLGFVGFQSASGAMSGAHNFREIHPDFLAQQFLARAGSEIAQKVTTLAQLRGEDRVKIQEVFVLNSTLNQVEGELKEIRNRTLPATISPDPTKLLLVVRLDVDNNEADKDNLLRFSTGSVRLSVGGKNHYPLGTLERGNVLVANAIDDPIRAELGTIDFVYQIDRADIVASEEAGVTKFKPDAFIEFRRLGRVSLADKPSTGSVPEVRTSPVRRKLNVAKAIAAVGQ